MRIRITFALLTALASTVQAQAANSTLYVGTYARSILILDEATLRVRDSMKVSVGVPIGMVVSPDRNRMYVWDPGYEHVEVFDIASRKAIDKFTLSEGNKRVRFMGGFNVDPKQRYAVMVAKTYTKKKWVLAHELGHAAGLREHASSPTNFMYRSAVRYRFGVTASQSRQMARM